MVVIILTTTVNVHNKCYLYQTDPLSRLNIYLKSINEWLKSSFKIVIVENSGHAFKELSVTKDQEIIFFNESTLPDASYLKDNNSKGASELFSINWAIKYSKIINPEDFIIKITGRYFIPHFEEYLLGINLKEYNVLCQNDRCSCEIVGCSFNKIDTIFNKYNLDNHIETTYTRRIKNENKILVLKKLNIEGTPMGGVNTVRYNL